MLKKRRKVAYRSKVTGRNTSLIRFYIIRLSFIIFSIVLVARLAYLQIFQHSKLSAIRKRQLETTVKIDPPRGNIFDSNGTVLAESLYLYSVYANPSKIENKGEVADKLARILGMDKAIIQRLLKKQRRFVWIKRHITREKADRIRALKLPYVGLLNEYKRFYPYGAMAEHILGIVDIDNKGLEGVEYKYDKFLRGVHGWVIMEQDAYGRNLLSEVQVKKPPKVGYDLYLTIDADIQRIAEDELEFGVKLVGAQGGSVIICDPKTGAILALANYPRFDPNYPQKYSPAYRRNRAITDLFEPGSTFKIVTVSAALDKKLITPNDKFYCENGRWRVYNHYIHDDEKNQWLTVREIIEKSSNIGTIKIAHKLKKQEFYEYIRKFGFGEKTGIDLPGEALGILRPPNKWSGMSFYAIPIGHEVAVTGIQLLMAINVIANEGYLMRPYVVKKVVSPEGIVYESKPMVRRKVIDARTAHEVADILKGVVEKGTGQHAKISGYEFSGKTGTAQIYDFRLAQYSSYKVVSSFAGFFPSDNPKVTMVVIIREPSRLYYGGSVAAPIFKRIAEQIIRKLNILPDEASSNSLVSMIQYSNDEVVGKVSEYKNVGMLVPNFRGNELSEVEQVLNKVGLPYSVLDIEGKPLPSSERDTATFVIVSQVPPAGESLNTGETIYLTVKMVSVYKKKVIVPNFEGLTMREARRRAVLNSLNVNLYGSGLCVKQNPPAGSSVKPFTYINLYFEDKDK